jgi:hypothetical protein
MFAVLRPPTNQASMPIRLGPRRKPAYGLDLPYDEGWCKLASTVTI